MLSIFIQLLHNVCCIGEALILLQQAGNVYYIGWRLEVKACSTQSVSVLKELATSMQDELRNWEEEVEHMREEFYELNYYTTLQLLTLREQLAVQRSQRGCTPLSHNVLTLLQSVSRTVTSDIVCRTLQELKLKVSDRSPSSIAKEQKIINSRSESDGDNSAALDLTICSNQDAEKHYLGIRELGLLLERLGHRLECT